MSDEAKEQASEHESGSCDCPSCGAENPAYRRVCKYCRKPLTPGSRLEAELGPKPELLSPASARPFRAMPVVGQSLSIIIRKIHVLLAVIAVCFSPVLIYSVVEASMARRWDDLERWYWITMSATYLFSWVSSAFVVTLTERWMRGERADVATVRRVGLRRVIPAITVGFLFWLSMLAISFALGLIGSCLGESLSGLLALLVWAIIWCKWWVATPAAVIEGHGAMSGLRRSSQLTMGKRWRIFGATLLFSILAFGVFYLAFVLLALAIDLAVRHYVSLIGVVVAWALVAVGNAVIVTVGYWHLRGTDTHHLDDLAQIFD